MTSLIKTIITCSNQRPWMTADIHAVLRARYIAFRAGDKEALSTARATLARAIRDAKRVHAQKIHGHFKTAETHGSCGRAPKPSPTTGQ